VKILFVANLYPSPERPGHGAFVAHQAEHLRQFGHIVDVVNIHGFQSKLNYVKGTLEVFEKTTRTAYDVVHAHYGYSAFPAWFRRHAPLVVTLHGSDVLASSFQWFCSWGITRFADAVIVVSEEMRKRIPGIVIPCGVDLNVFRPYDRNEARARLGWPRDKNVILFPFDPARLLKRYDLAKAAVEQMAQKGVDTELMTVVGVANHEMPWYYSAADVMLLCSDHEGSPTSVKEALACNIPVVATDVGDVREILYEIAGTQICRQEVGDIACKLLGALDLSRRGKFEGRLAMARYDQALTVEKIIGVYTAVLNRFSMSARRMSIRQRG
jgi:glycosyltransferase involved in cell wall biosynthesis